MMAKYSYPAVFTPEKDGGYSITFPDLEGCYTCGDDIADSLKMVKDVLTLMLYSYESDGRAIPAPSAAADIPLADGEFVNFIICDTFSYHIFF